MRSDSRDPCRLDAPSVAPSARTRYVRHVKLKEINWVAMGAGLMLLVGFFLPWIRIESVPEAIAGWQLGIYSPKLGAAYYAAYLVPVLGALMAVLSVKKPRWASGVGIAAGATILGWGVFEVARFLYTRTFAGLWLSLAGAALMFIGGLITWKRGRAAKAEAKALAGAAKEIVAASKGKSKAKVDVAPAPAEEELEEMPEMSDEDMKALDEALEGLDE